MALLVAGQGKKPCPWPRTALRHDPKMARAAYNLCIMLSKDRLDETVGFCKKAAEISPEQPRYASTLAFYQQRSGDSPGAEETLNELIAKYPDSGDAYFVLGRIYEKQGKGTEAQEVYKRGLAEKNVPVPYKVRMKTRLEALERASSDAKETN